MGREQIPVSDTMLQDVSERTRKHLEASHHCFNASTFKKKLDFFDTCIDNDDGDAEYEVGSLHDDVYKSRGSQNKPTGSKSMRNLHESTIDFLIEEDGDDEKEKSNLSVDSKATDQEHSGALEALFTINHKSTTPRTKSASSNSIGSTTGRNPADFRGVRDLALLLYRSTKAGRSRLSEPSP